MAGPKHVPPSESALKSSPEAHCHLPRSLGYLHGGPFTPLVGPDLKSPTTNAKTDNVKTPSKWLVVPPVATGTARTRYDNFFFPATPSLLGCVGLEMSSAIIRWLFRRRDETPYRGVNLGNLEMLTTIVSLAVPQVAVQPWCSRLEDPDLRSRPQARDRRRLPSLHPPRLQRV